MASQRSMLSTAMTTTKPFFHLDSPEERALSEDVMWEALARRDHRFDSAFFYGARSTGIYCRPSCPSRRPLKSNVIFFDSPGQAETAGYRPCKRCKPDDHYWEQGDLKLSKGICNYLERNYGSKTTLADLAMHFGLSQFHLQRVFKRTVGVSPKDYLRGRRLRRLKSSLREGESVRRSVYDAGYNAPSCLYSRDKNQLLGMNPATYRSGGRGTTVRYLIMDSPLGRLLVAATPRGICKVGIGDSDEELQRALRSEFAHAKLGAASPGSLIYLWTERILRSLSKGATSDLSSLPLDIQASAFQLKVWKALRDIPRGSTLSYGDVADKIGYPDAARAVGRACGQNPTAIVVPCHRVVRKNGHIGGYRWGIRRKRVLLEAEGAIPAGTSH
jgi:AraC family transcriptional regulator, regulatory protein of adaptative response / methylated-DNA-[protein]-cysteine methyltransferase